MGLWNSIDSCYFIGEGGLFTYCKHLFVTFLLMYIFLYEKKKKKKEIDIFGTPMYLLLNWLNYFCIPIKEVVTKRGNFVHLPTNELKLIFDFLLLILFEAIQT